MSNDFQCVAKTQDVPADGKLSLEVDDRFVVIVRVEGQYYCIDDVCSHDGGPLGDGDLDGFCLACPRHGAKFDVRTGEAVTMPATEGTSKHEVECRGEEIWVKLSDD